MGRQTAHGNSNLSSARSMLYLLRHTCTKTSNPIAVVKQRSELRGTWDAERWRKCNIAVSRLGCSRTWWQAEGWGQKNVNYDVKFLWPLHQSENLSHSLISLEEQGGGALAVLRYDAVIRKPLVESHQQPTHLSRSTTLLFATFCMHKVAWLSTILWF